MRRTIFDTPGITAFARLLSVVFLKCIGWRADGRLPDAPKYVMIAAPHTSNWDLPIMMALGFVFRAKLFWMTKDSVFRWPFGGFLKWLGGIPIDRSKANGVVAQCVELLDSHETLILGVPPEGTRKRVRRWKTGFYYIALGARVPIALGFLDYGRKAGGIGGLVMPTGDFAGDMARIRDFYATIVAKYPDQTVRPALEDEDKPA